MLFAPCEGALEIVDADAVAPIGARCKAADRHAKEGHAERGAAAAGDVNAADIAQRLVESRDLLVLEHLVRDHLGRERRLHDRRIDLGPEQFDRRGIGGGIVTHPVRRRFGRCCRGRCRFRCLFPPRLRSLGQRRPRRWWAAPRRRRWPVAALAREPRGRRRRRAPTLPRKRRPVD